MAAKNGNVNNDKENSVTPALIMSHDIGAKMDGYELGQIINNQFKARVVEGIQEVRSMWRVYMFKEEDKIKLCDEGLTLPGNRKVKCYLSNPFATGAVDKDGNIEDVQMVRLTIRDLLKSMSNDDVVHMLTKVYKLTLASEVKYAQYRDPDGHLTYMKSFDSFVFVHPDQLKVPLPRNAQCGVWRCRLFYKGQFKPSKVCFRCFAEDHMSRNCPNGKACKVCHLQGHEPGSPRCPYYTINGGMRVFGGASDPLSNHYKCDFEYNDVKVKSVEH